MAKFLQIWSHCVSPHFSKVQEKSFSSKVREVFQDVRRSKFPLMRTSVTRWLDYLFIIGRLAKMKIDPTALKTCTKGSSASQIPNCPLSNGQIYFKYYQSCEIWSHWQGLLPEKKHLLKLVNIKTFFQKIFVVVVGDDNILLKKYELKSSRNVPCVI